MTGDKYDLKIEVSVTQAWLDDNLVGSGALSYEWWRAFEYMPNEEGIVLTIADPNDSGGDGPGEVSKTLTWAQVAEAINALCASSFEGKSLVLEQIAADDIDADGADCILQWCALSDVPFG